MSIDQKLMKELNSLNFDRFSGLIRFLRERKGISLRAMSLQMNKGKGYYNYIHEIEHGRSFQSPSVLKAYISYFRLDPEYVSELSANEVKSRHYNKLKKTLKF